MITTDHLAEMSAKAQEAKKGRPCPICKLYPFYIVAGTAMAPGHVYSRNGLAELSITGMCEHCFDAMELPEERAERTGGLIDPDVPHDLPLDGLVLQTVTDLDTYDAQSGRFDTDDKEYAQVITSLVARDAGLPVDKQHHKVVLDLDLPAQLIPSSTEGHFHLYIDKEMPWDVYVRLLTALAAAGIIEQGYLSASLERGLTAVRLPWVKKPEPKVYELIDRALDGLDADSEGMPF
jgi:hypothetical protein